MGGYIPQLLILYSEMKLKNFHMLVSVGGAIFNNLSSWTQKWNIYIDILYAFKKFSNCYNLFYCQEC